MRTGGEKKNDNNTKRSNSTRETFARGKYGRVPVFVYARPSERGTVLQ